MASGMRRNLVSECTKPSCVRHHLVVEMVVKQGEMDIKWTAGPGPAPLPYSKRAREAMGYSDDDKPWAHPDPPTAQSFGLSGGDNPLRDARLRTSLFIAVGIVVLIWMYRRFVARKEHGATTTAATTTGTSSTTRFFASPTPTPAHHAQASTEDARKAREARLKRFQQQKSSYATIMQEAATGWAPGDDRAETGNTSGSGDAGGAETSKGGLRHRGATKPS